MAKTEEKKNAVKEESKKMNLVYFGKKRPKIVTLVIAGKTVTEQFVPKKGTLHS